MIVILQNKPMQKNLQCLVLLYKGCLLLFPVIGLYCIVIIRPWLLRIKLYSIMYMRIFNNIFNSIFFLQLEPSDSRR